MPSREAEIAWAAGLFEGEGCCTFNVRQPVIRVTSTDLDVLEKFRDVVGAGRIYGPQIKDGLKPKWNWIAQSSPEVIHVLRQLMPWFCERRTIRAEEVLVQAWRVLGGIIMRFHRETLFGDTVRERDLDALAFAIGEDTKWVPRHTAKRGAST